jgi:hypothetical protein
VTGLAVGTAGSAQAARIAIDAASPSYVNQQIAAADIAGQVAAAVADDATVINAAAAAVDAEITGRDLVETDDPRLPDSETTSEVHWGLRDNVGRVQLSARTDGRIDIPLPTLGGMNAIGKFSPNRYIKGTLDSAGRVAEDALTADGLVPDWVLQRWSSRMTSGLANTYTDWIIVCGGQSNMAGSAPTVSGIYDSDSRLVQYNAEFNQLDPVPDSAGALWATLGRAMVERAPANVRIIVVKSAAGSTGFTTSAFGTWDRTNTEDEPNLYVEMVDGIAGARSLSPDAKIVGFFWSQGESDSGALTQSEYSDKFVDLVTDLRSQVDDAELPVVVGSMEPLYATTSSGRIAVQKALTDIPRLLTRAAFVFGPKDIGRSDQDSTIHYNTAHLMERARLMVAGLFRARWNQSASVAVPPQNLRLSRSGTVLTASWDAPNCRHTAFTVEVTVNAGSSWAAMTLPDGPIGLTATATITASDVVQVRASTTNDVNTSQFAYATA